MRNKTEKMKLSEHGTVREEALLAYLTNQLTGEERTELELLLENDPFAQEALEGLRQTNGERVGNAVGNINKKIAQRSGQKINGRGIRLHWTNFAWAAVVLGLLLGVGFLMVNYVGSSNTKIALNQPAEESNIDNHAAKEDAAALIPEIPVSANTDSTAFALSQDETSEAVTSSQETKLTQPDQVLQKTAAENTMADPAPVAASGAGSTKLPALPAKPADKDKQSADPNAGAKPEAKSAEITGDTNKEATTPKEENTKNKKATTIAQRQVLDEAPAAGATTQLNAVAAPKEKHPTIEEAMNNFNAGNYKKSAEQFNEIMKQQPNNTDALYFGGISEYIVGNTKKSEKNFDQLLKDGTKFVEGSKWYKANILLKRGKIEDAKVLLNELANSSGSYRERAVKKISEIEF